MKKRFYTLLVLSVCAVFLFGCDNPSSSPSSNNNKDPNNEDEKSSKPKELVLFEGAVHDDDTAVLTVKRESDGSFKFYLDRINHSYDVIVSMSAQPGNIYTSSPFRYNSGYFKNNVYAISSEGVAMILNATKIWGFKIRFTRNMQSDIIDLMNKADALKEFLQ